MERLRRQLGIENWDQPALSRLTLTVVGDSLAADILCLSAAALGVGRIHLIRPGGGEVSSFFVDAARRIGTGSRIHRLDGYLVNAGQQCLLGNSDVVVDISSYSLAKRVCLDWCFRRKRPALIASLSGESMRVFCYCRGRENQRLAALLPTDRRAFPGPDNADPLLALVATGLVLEEVKNLAFGRQTSPEVVSYQGARDAVPLARLQQGRALVVGAGALGNFVCLGLDRLGVRQIHIVDHDTIAEHNLNRQVLFFDAVGRHKAQVLAERLSAPGVKAMVQKFDQQTPLGAYAAVFDCVDDFGVRKLLSERCAAARAPLISGGTSPHAGQVVSYVPGVTEPTHVQLDLDALLSRRAREREQAAARGCTAAVEHSVIMSNQIVGGIMVDRYRRLLARRRFNGAEHFGRVTYNAHDEQRVAEG